MMNTSNVAQFPIGFSIRVLPCDAVTIDSRPTWSILSGDIDYWPNVMDCVPDANCWEPVTGLWRSMEKAQSQVKVMCESGVLVAVTLPVYHGCQSNDYFKAFAEWVDFSIADLLKTDDSPLMNGDDALARPHWTLLGYDIMFAGALKSMLYELSTDEHWFRRIDGERTAYGLYAQFSEALVHATTLSEVGLSKGWALEETLLWPLGLWAWTDHINGT